MGLPCCGVAKADPDYSFDIDGAIVHLARLALTGRRQDVLLYLRRLAGKLSASSHSAELTSLIREMPSYASPIRGESPAIPVDRDTRLQLVRIEYPVTLPFEPIWASRVQAVLDQIVRERNAEKRLIEQGLAPSRSAILTGAPGVGKTMAARWLARALERPLLVLDLSAVMSSFLGRTGANVRYVLDYAKESPSVLLLDEFDSIAKRRDDSSEVGELKRLVTVLLQEIDDWPASGLLVAATNHPGLLDPAVWRRFEVRIDFPMPDSNSIRELISKRLGSVPPEWLSILSVMMAGRSFSDIDSELNHMRRAAVVGDESIERSFEALIDRYVATLGGRERIAVAQELLKCGLSQRRAHALTGVSRDTIRRHADEA